MIFNNAPHTLWPKPFVHITVQGIYLVALGWNEGSVGIALSVMGFTALLTQTIAGDIIDKTTFDRRRFLAGAALMTAFSASAIMFVREGNVDHAMMYTTKIIEGVSSSFIGPCVAALTLASFGPDRFDEVMGESIQRIIRFSILFVCVGIY